MKTRPKTELLPLPLEPEISNLMNFFYKAIHEVVCYGTHILHWILKTNEKNPKNTNELITSVPLLSRHILELTDSIFIQVKSGVIVPSKLQMRAVLEAFLSLEYLLKEDSKREERSGYYFIVDHYRKLNFYKKLIPGTQENIEYRAKLKKHGQYLPDIYESIDGTEAYNNMHSLINLEHYKNANEKYCNYTANNTKKLDNLKWYALDGGPSSLYTLSIELNRYDFYESLYKPWSEPNHGTNLFQGVIDKGEDGLGTFNQLRVLTESRMVVEMTLVLNVTIYLMVVEKTVPKEIKGMAKWAQQFNEAYLSKVKRIITNSKSEMSDL